MKKFSLLVFLFCLTACNGALQNELVEDKNPTETNVMNRELPGRTMSDQNPNLIHTGSERNQGTDIEYAKKVISDTGEFTPDSVWINGNDLWVTAHTDKNLSAKEKMEAQAKLHKILIAALPSYDIEVKVNED
ncbi:hypothetical protein J27TS8_30700 [Robertmurraya siralis]|uniref:Uncharacterized protein n=1 Tax=Robertmurraya siralis TaxID=77777 RepID=A0A919WJW5_9BACI|nr:hypothetical protein [Robertmurraya siralis]GIN63077.1 hypothetical protein J27TS8_30700 [Robertmurraya siralis]